MDLGIRLIPDPQLWSVQIYGAPPQIQNVFLDVVVNYRPWWPGKDGWRFGGGSCITVADIATDTWRWFIDPSYSWEAIDLQGPPLSSDPDNPNSVFWLKMPGSQKNPTDLNVGDSGDLFVWGHYFCSSALGNHPTWTVQWIA